MRECYCTITWFILLQICFQNMSLIKQHRIKWIFEQIKMKHWWDRYKTTKNPDENPDLPMDVKNLKKKQNPPTKNLKGTVPRDFWLQVFSWISFPQAPESTIIVISNFLENLWRYYQHKVPHRWHWHWWQIEKLCNQKSFNYFFRHLWVV